VAIGNDVQWQRLTEIPAFKQIASDQRATNKGRMQELQQIYQDIGEVTSTTDTAELVRYFQEATIAHAIINTVPEVRELEAIRDKLTTTQTPDGKLVHMQPMPVDEAGATTQLSFPPKYGEHTHSVLAEAGYEKDELIEFESAGIIST
jgi:crotonobetainyl-CoA:carnitine CoA-transferase CaiB-like acyl-CoA transferase